MDHKASSKMKMAEMSIAVIRADGTREELGVVAKTFANPLKQICWNLSQWIKRHIFYKGN